MNIEEYSKKLLTCKSVAEPENEKQPKRALPDFIVRSKPNPLGNWSILLRLLGQLLLYPESLL